MTAFENRILHYMEAGFPILYLNTFEEGKARETIRSISAENLGHCTALEWDGTDRICDICTGKIKYDAGMPLRKMNLVTNYCFLRISTHLWMIQQSLHD